MKKKYLKPVIFLSMLLLLLLVNTVASTTALAEVVKAPTKTCTYYMDEYTFSTEDGMEITREILRVPDPENYYFKKGRYALRTESERYHYDYYMLYEKESDKRVDTYGVELILLGDEVYLTWKAMDSFYYLGTAENGHEYWAYFDANGKLVKDTVVHGLYTVDKNGLFDFHASDLYKRMLDKYTTEYYDGERSYYESVGYSEEEIEKRLAELEPFTATMRYSDIFSTKKVGYILNRIECSFLGEWVAKGTVQNLPEYTCTGHFEKTSDGQLKYLADALVKHEQLYISPIKMISQSNEGYKYQYDETYDYKHTVIKAQEYLTDILIELEGETYYFDKDGIAAKNEWIYMPQEGCYFYFDENGHCVTDSWVARDGELYRVGSGGAMVDGIVHNPWYEKNGKHICISEDGTIYYGAREEEYKVFQKLLEFQEKYPGGSHIGICGVFANKFVEYAFGKNAKGTTYEYNWDDIKVGDTISGKGGLSGAEYVSHIIVVLAKTKDYISFAESNWDDDEATHYGRSLGRWYFDELYENGEMDFEFTTYYSAKDRNPKEFKPKDVTFSAEAVDGRIKLTLDRNEDAVKYRLYMCTEENGKYERIKTINGENELVYTTKKLESGTYYFKARSCIVIDGQEIWGNYSRISCTVPEGEGDTVKQVIGSLAGTNK